MSYLPQTKWGQCCQCGATETNVVKVAKDYFCIPCHQENKTKAQIKKASVRQQVRGLVKYERAEGILDSTQELILDLDRVVSRYLRLREMDKDGKCQCFTCTSRREWNKVHAGHFISRTHLGLRWDLTYNLRVQCPICNVQLHGNYVSFKMNLEAEQRGITDYLYEKSKEVYSPTRDELKMLLHEFQLKLSIVEKKLTNHAIL